jgi:cytochrome c-type biogenesis protein CcmH
MVHAQEKPDLEKRVMQLSSELRCLVCQNQTIADSNADLAVDLRNRIREQLEKGASEDQVRDFMVQRYGDFVLYKPPLKASTVLLWFGPLLFLLLGVVAFWRKTRTRPEEPALAEEDRIRAAKLLDDQ